MNIYLEEVFVVKAVHGETLLTGPDTHVPRVVEAHQVTQLQPRREVTDSQTGSLVAHQSPSIVAVLLPLHLLQGRHLQDVVRLEASLTASSLHRAGVLGLDSIGQYAPSLSGRFITHLILCLSRSVHR